MSDQNSSQTSYVPDVKRSKGISPLWLLPILTMVLAGWLVVKSIHDAGQRVQIYFSDAAGLVAGRTTIRYQGLEVGMVRDINLTEDLGSIYVEFETTFHALDSAPTDLRVSQGLNIKLKSRDLGGVSVGSQIVYKKIPIGEVYSYQLDEDAKSITIQANIQDQYRHIINNRSRFWNVSGIGASIGFEGVDVRLESMSALLGGAIAVDSPDDGEPVEENTEFRLYKDLKTAGRGIAVKIVLPDDSKISGEGAPIMYRGIEIGQVTDLGVENIANLVRGNFLTIVPGAGERSRRFTAIRKNVFNQQQEKSIAIRLVSDNSFGLDSGANVLYKGIVVGSIIKVGLVKEDKKSQHEVFMDVLIDHEYKHLIKSNNRFYVTGSASAELTESGLSVTVPPAKQLLTGSISFVSEGKQDIQKEYQLFQNESLAELAQYNQSGSRALTLFASELPPISKGSPLLYRNLPVGNVSDFQLVDGGV
ncbi:MlaD family protein, partial [Vibrio alginolyticus]